jgi:integrase
MHTVFNRAVRDQRIDRNPVALVKKPPTLPKTRIVPTTPEEVEMLRAKLLDADAVLVAILAYTGVRPGEARCLQWADLSERNVHVWRSVGPEGIKETKTTQTRSVPLCATLKADLNAWKRQLGSPPPDSFILPRADGDPWTDDDFKNWQKRRFKTGVQSAGINLARPYNLRHSAASLWIAEGRNVVEVAAWLGHQPTETLTTYAHVVADRDPSDKRTVDERIAAARRDISVTYERGKAGQPAVRRKTRKRRQKAVLGTSA